MYQKIKIITLLAFITLFGVSAMAQDVIVLKNGDEIKSLVQEIGIEYVKYKKFDNQTGPTYNVAITQIFMIKYANGTRDVFNQVVKPSEQKAEQTNNNNDNSLAGKRMFLSSDGRNAYFENSDYIITSKAEIGKFFMENCFPAFDQYKTGTRLRDSGNNCLAAGIPLAVLSVGLWFLPYSIFYAPIITGGFTGLWIGGAINLVRGNKMIKDAFDTYNIRCASSKNYSSRLELGLTGNGIGVLITF